MKLILGTYENGFWFLTSVLFNCFVVSSITLLSRDRMIVAALLLAINFGLWFVNEDYLYKTHNYMFTFFILGYLYNFLFEKPMISEHTSLVCVFIAVVVFLICAYIYLKENYISIPVESVLFVMASLVYIS